MPSRRPSCSCLILRRFHAERQILAALNHDNIARLLDGGATEDGRPYLVMEYVEGVLITQYCDQHRLTVPERLRLFRKVCAAVHYAHQNLIVHRDLKPPNILVTSKGVPKLLDFGIAKMLNPGQAGYAVVQTRTELRVMTPEYASPEQVRGEMITTASDVYALGVLLYELLTGHRPYRLASRLRQEIEHAICEEEPERPSTAVSAVEEVRSADGTTRKITPDMVSRDRRMAVARLRRRLAGDLDNMVLMALKKDPAQRYASAEQFSEDMRRHLAGLPVQARPDTVGYRASKFVRRHRWGVSMAAVIVLLLMAFSAVMAGLMAEVAHQRDMTERELDRWRVSEAKRAKDPQLERALPADPQIDSLLFERMAAYVDTYWKEDTLGRSQLTEGLAGFYGDLGYYEPMVRLTQQVVPLYVQMYGEQNITETVPLKGFLARRLIMLGDYAGAETLLREVVPLQLTLLEENWVDGPRSAVHLGQTLHYSGDFEKAEAITREALAFARRNPDGTPADPNPEGRKTLLALRLMTNLARLDYETGNLTSADALTREVRSILARYAWICRRKYQSGDFDIGGCPLNQELGRLSLDLGDIEAADSLLREALDAYRTHYGKVHPEVAPNMQNLGALRAAQGDYAAADSLLRKALVIHRVYLPADHPRIAATLHDLGRLHASTGAYEEADSLLREALAVEREQRPDNHPHLARILLDLGRAYLGQGNPARAEPRLREALGIRQARFGAANVRTAEAKVVLGTCLTTLRRYAEAEPLLKEGRDVLQAALGLEHLLVRQAEEALARM